MVINMKVKMNFKISDIAFYYASFVFMEFIFRAFTCEGFFDLGLLISAVFAVIPTFISIAVGGLFDKTAGRITGGILLGLYFVLYSVQTVYHGTFGTYMIMYSAINGGAEQIAGEGVIKNVFESIFKSIPSILILAIPFVLFFVFAKNIKFRKKNVRLGVFNACIAVVVAVITPLVISLVPSLNKIRTSEFGADIAVRRFGLIYTEVLDIKYNVLGFEQEIQLESENRPSADTPDNKDEEIDTSPNVGSVDLASLNSNNKTIQSLNTYFASKSPTNKNKYTGMYEGYNLISITAEGFSPYAVDPVLTPTLYKMSEEGFKFTNFYTPIWGVSTSDGEYMHCTGLIPKSGVWSFYQSSENYMPYCYGNMFKSIGVKNTFAYHNHTYTYYHRDLSHPNMGYTYKGVGNGLEGIKKQWPESDLEMINASVGDYINSGEQFCAYYMTVSGHLNYTKIGNMMAYKNWSAVEHLDCSDELKAYYACNIELDKAMEELLRRLNEAGIADKTVITITPDHYPYGLEKEGSDKYALWRELLGRDVETNFELYKSNFILYCQGTKDAPTIDKYCATIDVLPTVLNLFGFEYDSRLLSGSDILSTEEQLVIFSNRSFITDRGRYNAKTKEFTLFGGVEGFASEEEKEDYIKAYKNIVNNKFQTAAKILETDYYGYVFGK